MKKNHRTIVVCCAVGLFALACMLAASRVTRSRPPQPQAATPEQTVEYLASEAFVKMDTDDKRQYVREIQVPGSRTPVLALLFNSSVPEEQRRRVLENILPVVRPVIEQRLDEFDRLPSAEQTARLDAVIDQLQEARRSGTGTMSSVERLNLILQYVDPHTRAKIRKHIPALLVRMKERGIQGGYPF
jgi:hypothetical protein